MKKIKLYSIYMLSLMVLAACGTASKSKKADEMELYLLVGQSNMAGRGVVEEQDKIEHPQVYVLGQGDQWVPAKEPLHYDKAGRGVGPGLEFGKAMADRKKGVRVGLIPAAVGGTKISYWKPGSSRGLYEEAIRKAKVAMQQGKLKGIVWQQGESDSNTKDAPLYKERLVELMQSFRKDLGSPDLPIVLGGLGDFLKAGKQSKQVNQAIQEAAKELGNAEFSEASKLGHIGDRLHFNSAAQRENGKNMAKAMQRLVK